jgi:hypothetical protein
LFSVCGEAVFVAAKQMVAFAFCTDPSSLYEHKIYSHPHIRTEMNILLVIKLLFFYPNISLKQNVAYPEVCFGVRVVIQVPMVRVPPME